MFVVNDDNSIYVTRGDILFFTVTAEDEGKNYKFQPGDVVRIKVFGKKDAENVVLQKDFPVMEVTEEVEIFLSEEDTKIGEVISKPTDYWYEVELNPYDNPQTIIGYDEDGAKLLKLFPEGDDVPEFVPETEDIPVVDEELDLASSRPVQNQAIARAFRNLEDGYDRVRASVEELYVTPEMFGAIGDGEADDTESVQAAIDAAHEQGRPVMLTGNYMVSESLVLRSRTILYGYGASVYYSGSGVCIKAEGTSSANLYAKVYGLSVRSKSETPVGVGVSIKKAYMGTLFEDCGVYGFDVGIDHSSAEDGNKAWLTTISRCRISNCNTAVVFNDESNGCNLVNCLINKNNQYGVKLIGVHNVNITECEFESNGTNGGCAIFLQSCGNVNIARCYFEGNGANVSESHVILFSATGTNYSININNNWIHAGRVTSAIKIRNAHSVNVVGNNFYGVSDTSPLVSDIDMTEVTGVYFFIAGNQIAAGITHGSLHPSALVSYDGRGFVRNTVNLNGGSPTVEMVDTENGKTMKIMHVNNKLRFYNNDGVVVLQLNGDAKTVENFAVQRGTSANRPKTPPSGTMYFDTTLLKPIWAYENVWRTADGAVV